MDRIFFKDYFISIVIPAVVTVPQIPTTTPQTTTLETTVEQNKTNDSLKEELIFRQHLISQKLKHDLESRKQESKKINLYLFLLVEIFDLNLYSYSKVIR